MWDMNVLFVSLSTALDSGYSDRQRLYGQVLESREVRVMRCGVCAWPWTCYRKLGIGPSCLEGAT